MMKRWKALASVAAATALVIAPLVAGAASASTEPEDPATVVVVDDGVQEAKGNYGHPTPTPTPQIPDQPKPEFDHSGECTTPGIRTVTFTKTDWTWDAEAWQWVLGEPEVIKTSDVPDILCVVKVTPEPPVWVDECGPGNGHWTFPGEPVGYKYKQFTLLGYQKVLIEPAKGYVFPARTKVLFAAKEKNTAPCLVPLPAQFSAAPAPPTCDTAGALPNIADATPNVDLSFDRKYDGPGTYTLTATALNGFEFEGGGTVRTRDITVLGAVGYQSENAEAPCFQANETLVTPTADYSPPSCNAPGSITLGTDPGYEWTAVANEDGTYTYTAVPNEGYAFPEGAQTQWVADLGPALPAEECPTTPVEPEPGDPDETDGLAATGSTNPAPWALGGLATLLAGISMVAFRKALRA